MYLPGTINERIGDLRSGKGWSQRELAERIGIEASQLSRIENGVPKSISSDILVKLAAEFGVSTDYILGLTTISVPKSYDISQLGLSEGSVKAIVSGAIDVKMLNRLIEHKNFPYMLNIVKTYFDNTVAEGVMERNAIIDMATSAIGDFAKDNPELKSEARDDMRLLRSQKLGEHEAEIEKIKSTFMAILRDIKKDIDSGKEPGTSATADFLQQMREQVEKARKEQKTVTADDVTSMVMNMVGQTTALDDNSAKLFKQLVASVLKASTPRQIKTK